MIIKNKTFVKKIKYRQRPYRKRREALQLVLQEFTLEQKTNNQHLEALIAAVKNAETKIDASEKGHKIEKKFQRS
jgi:uncharacterized protein Yka (UPF0111/DUF47 family)